MRFLISNAFLIGVLCSLSLPATASEALIAVVDAGSGEDLSRQALAAVVGADDGVKWRGAITDLRANEASELSGGMLVLYVRGYDVRRMRFDSALMQRVEMSRAHGRFLVRAPDEAPIGLIVKCYVLEPGSKYEAMIMDRRVIPSHLGDIEIAVPKDAVTDVHACSVRKSRQDMVWPIAVQAQAGQEWTVHIEELKRLDVAAKGCDGLGRAEAFFDMGQDLAWPLERVDGLLGWDPTLTFGGRIQAGQLIIPPVPEADYHVFGTSGGCWSYAHARPGRKATLDFESQREIAADKVFVDGARLSDRARILPGRLDFRTCQLIMRNEDQYRGLVAAIGGEAEVAVVPAALTYTLWHPSRGLAYLRPTGEGTLVGAFEQGSLHLRLPRGASARGRVTVWSTVEGTGIILQGFLPGNIDHTGDWDGDVILNGLPLGQYRADVDLVLSTEGGSPLAWRERVSFSLTSQAPTFIKEPAPTSPEAPSLRSEPQKDRR